MRVIAFLLSGLICIVSCKNKTEPKVTDTDSAKVSDERVIISSPPYSVEYDEKTQQLNLVRSNQSIEGADMEDIIRSLNKKYEDIKLDLVKAGQDTIDLKIDDAKKLTQGMGSAGAKAYLAEVTFSLTELKGVKAVKIDFEEGDHAMPGVYTREDFGDLINPGKKE